MKAYFTKLFNYDHYTNRLILEAIIAANNPQKPVELMAHILGAQQVWLSRCKGEPSFTGAIWPDWPANQLAQVIDDNHKAWLSYLDTLNADDFEKIIAYKTTKGVPYEDKLTDILAHAINHGTHHRAQIGQLLKFAGVETLPPTDYIFYLRDL